MFRLGIGSAAATQRVAALRSGRGRSITALPRLLRTHARVCGLSPPSIAGDTRRGASTSSADTATSTPAAPVLQRGEGCGALRVGETYHNFTLRRVAKVPEYNMEALELTHARTGARYVHMDAPDANNVLSVLFRTPPASSSGVAHILEHTTLCGSRRFPVRDPFFNMIKRSLNTYMNALTGYDHTMYPFSTTNATDYANLRSVYMDAVFFPNLRELDFLQEGHRLAVTDAGDAGGPPRLERKGVVLNEMKGVLSDSNNQFATALQRELLRGTIYEHVSGGDPRHIPELTYDELRAFHATHYHPSNCCFYSYGDLPLTDNLAYLDQEVLSHFDYCADSAETRVDTPGFSIFKSDAAPSNDRLIVVEGPASNMASGGTDGSAAADPNTKYCSSKFVDVRSTDPFETFVMRVVGYLLTNGPSSPLYKALIDSGLAQDFSVGTGFDTSTYYCTFGVGVEGIEGEAAIPKIDAAVHEAYRQVIADGFDPERVEGLLHQLELSLKHIVGNFGLSLMHGLSSVWAHDGDLLDNLALNPLLTRLHDGMASNPRFLESYIDKYILDDRTKQVQVLMLPMAEYVAQQEAREAEELAAILRAQSHDDLDRIARITQELDAYQQQEQPVECLPTLTLKDIPLHEPGNADVIHHSTVRGVPVEFVDVPTTNEITYLRLFFDMTDSLPREYHALLNVFTSVFGALGTTRLPYDVLPTAIQNCSGGVSASALSHPSLTNARHDRSQQGLLVSTMCLPQKIDEVLTLLRELMLDTQFSSPENLSQLRILLQMSAANASSSISSSGASLAGTRSRLGLTDAALYHELYGGLAQIQQLQKWSKCSDAELRQLAGVLADIARRVFSPANLRVSVVTEDKLRAQVESSLASELIEPLSAAGSGSPPASSVVTGDDIASELLASLPASRKSYFAFPVSVNFVVQTLPSVSFAHEDHVPLTVLAQILSSCYVHQQVREQGGAYGAGVSQGEGSLSLSSHYDPNTWRTLEAFAGARQFACDGAFSDRDVQEALLSIFSSVDAPKTPAGKGKMAFLRGISNDMRQRRREQYLGVTKAQLVDAAQRLFARSEHASVVIVGKDGGDEALREFRDKQFAVQRFAMDATIPMDMEEEDDDE